VKKNHDMRPIHIPAALVVCLVTCSALAADPQPAASTQSVQPGDIAVQPATAATQPPIAAGQPSTDTAEAQPIVGQAPPPAEAQAEPLAPPPPRYTDLWQRIRAGFALAEVDSPLVARHEAWYLNRPDYVQRMIERSRLYLYFVVEELEKRGMPTEIALLPMIESAYNPQAYSRMRAAGIWQFIPSTGRKYGLQQNFWYDGRRDVLAATRAALDYLQFLHDSFGEWELALAAYNYGEGGVQRAVARNRARHKPTNYASLKMPRETRNYLPKLQAVKNIVSDPDLLGFSLAPIPNEPYFTTVTAPAQMDVVKAAALADMPVEEFRSLNPAYNRPVIIQATAREILLPVDKVDQFQTNLENNAGPLVSWQTYTLKPGESVQKVATKFNISVQRLDEVNAITRHRRVRPGQMLLVPLDEESAATNLDETYASPDFQASPEEYRAVRSYLVRPGDTLYSIARRNHMSVARIKAVNGLNGTELHVGQRVVLYGDYRPSRRTVSSRHHIRRVSHRN